MRFIYLCLACLFGVFIFLAGCLAQEGVENHTVKEYYKIVSSVPFESSKCGGSGFHYQDNGFDTGVMLLLKDNAGNNLTGRARMSFADGSGGSLPVGGFYACEQQVNYSTAFFWAFSEGHAPAAFELPLPRNELAVVEVTLPESCGGQSCFEALDLEMAYRSGGNLSSFSMMQDESRRQVYETLDRAFGINSSNSVFSCLECDSYRGGFVRAMGVYLNKTPFTLFYRWGWCSPGGGDCGWEACLKTPEGDDILLPKIREKLCEQVRVYSMREDLTEPGVSKMVAEVDNTNETITACLAGAFEETAGNETTISILQDSTRYYANATKRTADCLSR